MKLEIPLQLFASDLVAPLAGARIEISQYYYVKNFKIKSPLSQGRELKFQPRHGAAAPLAVAPLAGARIEIRFVMSELRMATSPLSQGRELKYRHQ